jgi:hypothetical protein
MRKFCVTFDSGPFSRMKSWGMRLEMATSFHFTRRASFGAQLQLSSFADGEGPISDS